MSSCSSSSSNSLISKENIEALGFFLVRDDGDVCIYRYQQYTLTHTKSTNDVKVVYGSASQTYAFVFGSIVLNITELENLLRRNGIIA